jgi:exodeoxyribonuclease X
MKAIVFDTESTGLDSPEIIEAAYIVLDEDISVPEIQREFCQRYKPTKEIEIGALATHHILDEELEHCPPTGEFEMPFDECYVIGHNVDYDMQFFGEAPNYKRICTLALSRRLWPELKSHNQSAMLYHINGRTAETRDMLRDAHSAGADVMNCKVVLDAIIAKTNPDSWEQLWRWSEVARVPTHMTFGKHKGTAIADLPQSYVDWFLKQADVDKYLEIALRKRK